LTLARGSPAIAPFDGSSHLTGHTPPSQPNVGRPRSFSDEDFFNAAARVLTRTGYPNLTLEAVAREAGCTRPAINRRFGGKQGLVDGFIEWIANRNGRMFELLSTRYESPVALLRAGLFIYSAGDDAHFDSSHHLEFFGNAWNESMLRPSMIELARKFERSAAILLSRAMDSGELRPCDTDRLASVLIAALCGVVILQPEDKRGELHGELLQAFDSVIEPYLEPIGLRTLA
jgi:AcrR family transcriptional regulator